MTRKRQPAFPGDEVEAVRPEPLEPMLGDPILYHVPRIGQEGKPGVIPGVVTMLYGEGRIDATLFLPGRWATHGNFTAEEMKFGVATRGPIDKGKQNFQWEPA